MTQAGMVVLETAQDTLQFDPHTARLISFRSHSAPAQEFIAFAEDHPAFVLGYFDAARCYHHLDSRQAESVTVELREAGDMRALSATYRRIAGLDLDVTTTVRASAGAPFSRWRISINNAAGLDLFDAQFPFVVCAYDLGGQPDAEALVLPHGYCTGRLMQRFKGEEAVHTPAGVFWRRKLQPDNWTTWLWNDWGSEHYPGWQFAQFLAYYNDRAGLYLACEDSEGRIKRFKVLHREPGFRLGVSHVGDWPAGVRELEYDTVLGSFTGDWHEAAGLYRDWSLRQSWATPLHARADVPAWLLDSPVYITIRPQGVLDEGPVQPIDDFLPYEKCIPLLDRIAGRVDAPVVAVLMGWERAGSWIYPDCFPPIGGEDSISHFARQARLRGWHVGTFGNGTQWLVGDGWNGYDGQAFFRERGGEQSVCRKPDGTPVFSSHYWRPGYLCCLGADVTRRLATDYVKRLIGWGFESMQFFDQNCFAVTFGCFARDHEHPPQPGRWMTEKMEQVIAEFKAVARAANEPGVIQSAESGVNEYCLPLFQEADVRVFPPGYESDVIPLYQFLFHECIVLQGMMSAGPEPYHVPISAAANAVLGGIPGGVLRGDGTLMDKDTNNWAPWSPRVGNDNDGLAMIRAVTALRRGPGKDFLVFGRMLRPAEVSEIKTVSWTHEGRAHHIPAVFHAAWQAPDGRMGVALANWTTRRQTVRVRDGRLAATQSGRVQTHVSGRRLRTLDASFNQGAVEVSLPPLSCALLVASASQVR